MNKIIYYLIYLLIILLATKASAYTEKNCISCHSNENLKLGSFFDIDTYRRTVHGNSITCLACHNNIKDKNHINKKNNKNVDCKVCHEQPSLHAKNGSVKCINCHPPHLIYKSNDPKSSVNQKNLKKTCGKCHLKETSKSSFLNSVRYFKIVSHSKQNISKQYTMSMCIGCHQGAGAHGEKKQINSQNCYKCHTPLDKKKGTFGYIHKNTKNDKKNIETILNYLFIAIVLVLFTFLIGTVFRAVKR